MPLMDFRGGRLRKRFERRTWLVGSVRLLPVPPSSRLGHRVRERENSPFTAVSGRLRHDFRGEEGGLLREAIRQCRIAELVDQTWDAAGQPMDHPARSDR